MRFYFLVFFFICFAFKPAFAQTDFAFKGTLIEKGTKIRVALAEIYNTRNKFSVGSNDLGFFQIKAKVGDTLIISKTNYSDQVVAVVDTKEILVFLNIGNTLNEVVISGKTKKQTLNDIKNEYRKKGSFYAGKPPFLSFLFAPLTALYELFGRTPKNARRFEKFYVTELKQTHIDIFFNETIIQKYSPLSGKELEDFMLNYRPEYEKAKLWTTYDGIKYIKDSYKNYSDTVGKKP